MKTMFQALALGCMLLVLAMHQSVLAVNVVLVHGYSSQTYNYDFTGLNSDLGAESDLLTNSSESAWGVVDKKGNKKSGNWEDLLSRYGAKYMHLPWDSKEVLTLKNPHNPYSDRPGWEKIAERYLRIIETGHCDDGCVLITHSTGGLVVDTMLSKAYAYRYSSDVRLKSYYKVWQKTVATIQVASAGGGTTSANMSSDQMMTECKKIIPLPLIAHAQLLNRLVAWLLTKTANGWDVKHPFHSFASCDNPRETLGVIMDLRLENARRINGADNTRIPSFMISGDGMVDLPILKPFLKGVDDGVVAMHSACGGNKVGRYDSCSSSMNARGELKRQKAPTPHKYHYPYIMTREGHGSQLAKNHRNALWWGHKRVESLVSGHGIANHKIDATKRWRFKWEKRTRYSWRLVKKRRPNRRWWQSRYIWRWERYANGTKNVLVLRKVVVRKIIDNSADEPLSQVVLKGFNF